MGKGRKIARRLSDRMLSVYEDSGRIRAIQRNKDRLDALADQEVEVQICRREAKVERNLAKAELDKAEAAQDRKLASDILAELDPKDPKDPHK